MSLFEGRDLLCIRGERRVFAGLNFTLPAAGALLLTGANGSGKSSLLRLMTGLLRPAQGTIRWADQAISADPEAHRARLHYLGHLNGVKRVLTTAENIGFWAGLAGGQGSPETALEGFALGPLAEVPGRLLSAGQERRVALARLLASPAELWLLDEPTVGLDRDSLVCLAAAVAGHRARGGRVVVATHTPNEIPDAQVLALDLPAAAAQIGPGPGTGPGTQPEDGR